MSLKRCVSFSILGLAGVVAALVLSADGFPPREAAGDDFRIDTEVFVGENEQPTSRTTTVFYRGVVYDFMSGPEKIAIFDQPRGRFILLDPNRKLKAEITTDEVQAFVGRLRSWAAGQDDEFLRFMADPKLEESTDEETGELLLDSRYLKYRVATTKAPNEAVAARYHEFSDWYAKLNSADNVAAPPPFARLQLNQLLAQRGEIPTAVSLTLSPPRGKGRREVLLRSKHHLQGQLAASDEQQIRRANDMIHAFRKVSLTDFVSATEEQRTAALQEAAEALK